MLDESNVGRKNKINLLQSLINGRQNENQSKISGKIKLNVELIPGDIKFLVIVDASNSIKDLH